MSASLMRAVSRPLLVVKAGAKNAAIQWDSEWGACCVLELGVLLRFST